MKHTQGEWKMSINKETEPFEVSIHSTANGNRILNLQFDEYGYGNDEEVLANAKLIAAAPDLLMRLKLTTLILEELQKQRLFEKYNEVVKTISKNNAAIEKATPVQERNATKA